MGGGAALGFRVLGAGFQMTNLSVRSSLKGGGGWVDFSSALAFV